MPHFKHGVGSWSFQKCGVLDPRPRRTGVQLSQLSSEDLLQFVFGVSQQPTAYSPDSGTTQYPSVDLHIIIEMIEG
jgi:hypothetical protein